jgi:hypothetical protein
MKLQRRFIGIDSHFMLRHDSARIGTMHHAVQGYAGFGFTVNQHPVQRCAATVSWQQRAVEVKRTFGSQA